MPRTSRRRTDARNPRSNLRRSQIDFENTSQDDSDEDTRRNLLELPLEILQYVLDYCFSPLYNSALKPWIREPGYKCVHQSLLLTCRALRDLSFDRYARTHIISFKEPKSLVKVFRSKLTPPVNQPLRYMSMDLYGSSSFAINPNWVLSASNLHHPSDYSLTLPDKLKRLVSFIKRYPELRHLEQLDIRLTMHQINSKLLHFNAVQVVENLISHHKNSGHIAYFFIRESYSQKVAWISIQQVPEDVWEKIPHETEEGVKGCDNGCTWRGVHICPMKEGQIVRSCEDIISQVRDTGSYTGEDYAGSVKENRAITWKAVRPKEYYWLI